MNMYDNDHKTLLRDLKKTVEYLLVSQVVDIWSIFGSLNRLHADVENIFKNGLKSESEDNISYWNFAKGLNWLQPNHSMATVVLDIKVKPHYPRHIFDHADSIWLYHSLENHSLSQQLLWLTSDVEHLKAFYENRAFLRQAVYVEALITCLKAVERHQQCLLSNINPSLFLSENENLNKKRIHRRTLSFPITQQEQKHKISVKKVGFNSKSDTKISNKRFISETRLQNFKLNKLWRSLPDFRNQEQIAQIINNRVKKANKRSTNKKDLNDAKPQTSKNRNINTIIINNQDIIEHKHNRNSMGKEQLFDNSMKSCPDIKSPSKFFALSKSPDYGFLDSLSGVAGEKDYKKYPRKTFIEDGGSSVLPMFTGYFPRPFKGQSLTSFLISSQFTRANAELDRENAHFCISDAIIAAMEQIRCRSEVKAIEDESDEEIQHLKQRIRMRRRQKIEEQCKSVMQMPVKCGSPTSSETSSDGVDDVEIDEACNLPDNRNLSMSMASLYSEFDLVRRPREAPDGASDILSAESVALSLISRFKETQLPRASELEWIVSEHEAPQDLLPLPRSVPISPDDSEEIPVTPLRGTREWAPPRPQIIFTLHPFCPRSQLLAKQNYRCAGCGMRVASQYAFKYRYCNYLGRYFCTGCHANQLSLIPAHIIQKWDFSRYKVSTFSYRLLEQMYTDPLFRVFAVNKNISKQSKNLRNCKLLRHGLFSMKDYILTCRFSTESLKGKLLAVLKEYPQINIDPDVYSMEDLVNVRSGDMGQCLKTPVDLCYFHISNCELCLARGFICRKCLSDEVIYPWQTNSVSRCSKCGECFHSKCWNSTDACLRCIRYNKRRQDLT